MDEVISHLKDQAVYNGEGEEEEEDHIEVEVLVRNVGCDTSLHAEDSDPGYMAPTVPRSVAAFVASHLPARLSRRKEENGITAGAALVRSMGR